MTIMTNFMLCVIPSPKQSRLGGIDRSGFRSLVEPGRIAYVVWHRFSTRFSRVR